jgi:hypothetical protein
MNFGTLEAAGYSAEGCAGEDVAVILRYDNPECELALNPEFCMNTSSTRACLSL